MITCVFRSLSHILNAVSLESVLEDLIDEDPSTTCTMLASARCSPNLV